MKPLDQFYALAEKIKRNATRVEGNPPYRWITANLWHYFTTERSPSGPFDNIYSASLVVYATPKSARLDFRVGDMQEIERALDKEYVL